jgi:hypothetical protein
VSALVTSQSSKRICHSIADVVLCIESDDERALEESVRFLKGQQTELASVTAGEPGANCLIQVGVGPKPEISSSYKHFFDFEDGHCYLGEEDYYLDIGESVVQIHPAEATARVWFGSTDTARSRESVVTVLGYALHGVMRSVGLFSLHAGAVTVSGGDAGALIVGHSGSGKSTLTVQLLRQGWSYLSDDILLLREAGNTASVWGLRREFSLSAEAPFRQKWPELDDHLGVPVWSDPQKRWLNPGAVFPGKLAKSCNPSLVLFPTITSEATSRIERIGQGEAMVRLLAVSPWAHHDPFTARAHMRTLALLANRCNCYALYAGRDILEEPERAQNLILGIVE